MPRSRPTEIPRATMAEQERHPPDGLEPIAESEHDRTYGMVGTSEAMLEVYEMVARVAPTTSTVLIQGETGTGKELIARAIHSTSRRGEHPFVTVDCSALAESLLESELFGHVKGAFTGAQTDKRGLIETAGGGTCFLDEIGEISACVQAKLLRVLQEREVRRVGGTDSVKVDVRVIAATNKELPTLVADGRFREDLFYRLSVVTIVLPPLRERREDIPVLAGHFLQAFRDVNAQAPRSISPEALALLVAYDWPGNVRELQHAIERVAALTTNPVLLPAGLPPKLVGAVREAASTEAPALGLTDVVKDHIRRVLKVAGWNKKLAAELLGIHRRTLYRLTKRHGISLSKRD